MLLHCPRHRPAKPMIGCYIINIKTLMNFDVQRPVNRTTSIYEESVGRFVPLGYGMSEGSDDRSLATASKYSWVLQCNNGENGG